MSGPTTGATSRLAGSAASGIEPNTGMATGATPIWAADVTPRASASQRGPGQRRVSRPGEQEDAERRADRQAEADRPDEERIDEHEACCREREQAEPGRGPARGLRDRGETGHRARAQHRGLEPRDSGEERDDADRRERTPMEAQPPQERRRGREHERDVLARDGKQVGQPRSLEPRRGLGVDASPVTDDEPEVERSEPAAGGPVRHAPTCGAPSWRRG